MSYITDFFLGVDVLKNNNNNNRRLIIRGTKRIQSNKVFCNVQLSGEEYSFYVFLFQKKKKNYRQIKTKKQRQ